MKRFDNEDPNPIGWPERAYWAALAQAEVLPDEVWALIWGPDAAFSKEVVSGTCLAPERLDGAMPPPEWARRDRRWTDLLRAVYAEIGEVPEQDEYKIENERFRTGGWNQDEGGHEREYTLSLNHLAGDDAEFIDYLEDETNYGEVQDDGDHGEFVDEIRPIAGLTKGEAAAVHWIVSGNGVLGTDYLERMSQALGISHNAAKMAWKKAKAKLREHWADAPE